jgi:hypothetical protein
MVNAAAKLSLPNRDVCLIYLVHPSLFGDILALADRHNLVVVSLLRSITVARTDEPQAPPPDLEAMQAASPVRRVTTDTDKMK